MMKADSAEAIHAVLPVISIAAGTGKIPILCRRQIGKAGKAKTAKIDPPKIASNLQYASQNVIFCVHIHMFCQMTLN